jgi:uncharacterized protein YaaQ
MKMIIVIVKDADADSVTLALTGKNFRVTRIASTGGFLRNGMVTLLIGAEEDQVEAGVQVIRDQIRGFGSEESQATLFVVPVQRFEKV